MTDYNDLITRLRSMDGKTPMAAADAIAELVARVAYLESRLEISPEHDIDGIAARDATIKLQDGRIAELGAERNIWRDKYMTQAGQLDLLKEAATFLASERASREKQEPVALLITDEKINSLQIESILRLIDRSKHAHMIDIKLRINGKDEWYEADWIKHMKRSAPIPTQGEVTAITQHEPVTTVEDRYNADGKSCHITDDLPAGMPLYAASPVAAPVRLTDSDVVDLFQAWNTTDGASHADLILSVETAVLRANGFKVEE